MRKGSIPRGFHVAFPYRWGRSKSRDQESPHPAGPSHCIPVAAALGRRGGKIGAPKCLRGQAADSVTIGDKLSLHTY